MRRAYCDGLTRRDFLQIGALPFLGLNMLDYLRAGRPTDRSCILFYLGGGISHIDTWDPKNNAPLNIRGEFNIISTSVPDVFVSELFPEQAQIANKLTIIRSFTHESDDHEFAERRVIAGSSELHSPAFSTVLTKLHHQSNEERAPLPNVFLGDHSSNQWQTANDSPFVSSRFNPFFVEHNPNEEHFVVEEVKLSDGITIDRLMSRDRLRQKLDVLKEKLGQRASDADGHWQQALETLTSGKISRAFDLDSEDPATRERYGRTPIGQRALLARRLVESGIPFIGVHARGYSSTGTYGFDFHSDIFKKMRLAAYPYDLAVTALISDLEQRGLLDKTLILALGEFGRTPKINDIGGRDHWPQAGSVLMAGLHLPRGMVHGATDATGARVREHPVSPDDLLATIYQLFGFPPATHLYDPLGRNRVISEGRPIAALL